MLPIIDEASDLEACKLLAANAKNLSLVISEMLRHTHTACIRIDEATRMKLGLSKTVSEILNQVSIYLTSSHGCEHLLYIIMGDRFTHFYQ